LAHVQALRTRNAWEQRRHWKWELVRGLYERNYPKRRVQDLFRFIDWVMALPADLEQAFDEQLLQYEKEKRMPYVTSIERLGQAKGLAEGQAKGLAEGRRQSLREGIVDVLEARFGEVAYALRERIFTLADEAELKRLHRQAALAESLPAFQSKL
jgi:predicted transposase YdaD